MTRRWLAVAASVVGCAEPPHDATPADAAGGGYTPYEGEAFPDRRAPIPVPSAGLALVVSAASDVLTAVDAGDASVLATLPVGRDPVTTDGPTAIAADRDGGHAYALLAYGALHAALHEKHAPHEQPGFVQKLALHDLSILGEVEVPEEPRGLALSDDGARLATAHWSSPGELAAQMSPDALEAARGRLTIIDAGSIEPVYSPPPRFARACIGARAVALSRPDAARAYVACFDEDAIAIADIGGDEISMERVPAGPAPGLPGLPVHGPTALAVSADGTRLFVANEIAKDIRVLHMATSTVDESVAFPTNGAPIALAAAPDGSVHVLTRAPAAVLHVPAGLDGPVLGEQPLSSAQCDSPAALALSGSGSLFVVCGAQGDEAGRVLILDAATLAVLGSAFVGADPRGVAVVAGSPR